jgi:UDP-N-acetylmuramoylalanine--D-glutamate ligase
VQVHSDRLKAAVVIGLDRQPVLSALAAFAPEIRVVEVSDELEQTVMQVAVREASALAEEGDVVLLAPAAASMDQFKDYADRGNQFSKAVGELNG